MTAPRGPGEALAPGYLVQEHLSRGNVLDVYAVRSLERDCLCVAKVLRPGRARDAAARSSLVHEGQLLGRLTHPHLVRGYEVTDSDKDGPVVVLETLTGATLSHLIETDHPAGLGEADVAVLGLQLCSVLHYLHRHGTVHRDLKPSNIVCTAGRAVLLDLSLAGPAGPSIAGTGTVEYMAPEQVAGGPVGAAADVWGLGGVLYRALTGRRPFVRTAAGRRVDDRIDSEPLTRRAIGSPLRDLVTRCFAPDPQARPTVDAARDALTAIVARE